METMFDNQKLISTIVFLVVVLLVVICGIKYIKRRAKGFVAERKVAGVLKKYKKDGEYIVMNNVYLPLYKGLCEVDHILIGSFGVLSIETKGISGKVLGSGKYLTHQIGNKKFKLYNPNLQNKTHQNNILHHLKKGKLSIPVYGVVVFTDDNAEIASNLGISLSELPSFIESLPKGNYDQRKVYDILNEAREHNLLKKLYHNLQVMLKSQKDR